MSTTFGIHISSTNTVEPIARRFGGQVWFTNTIAEFLPDNLEVIAMDNSNQGINTIGDIKSAIVESSKKLENK